MLHHFTSSQLESLLNVCWYCFYRNAENQVDAEVPKKIYTVELFGDRVADALVKKWQATEGKMSVIKKVRDNGEKHRVRQIAAHKQDVNFLTDYRKSHTSSKSSPRVAQSKSNYSGSIASLSLNSHSYQAKIRKTVTASSESPSTRGQSRVLSYGPGQTSRRSAPGS